jgi:hypothetical protein
MRKTRVIVLGGGMSGLACAKELLHRGCEVLVVEARSRVGGRLKCGELELQTQPSSIANNVAADTSDNHVGDETTTRIAPATSQPIDLGGALIHGIDKNPIHSLTLQMGVGLHKISDYCLLLDQNGWPFDPKQDEKLSTLFNECLEETFQRSAKDKQSEASFGNLFGAVCKERGVSSYTDNPLLKWHQANLELPSGADFDDLGYTWNDDEPYGFAGAHVALESSWKAVTERLAEGLDILYHSPVKGIAVVLPDGTVPSTTPPTQPPLSETSNDSEIQTIESSSEAVASSSSSSLENVPPIRSRSRNPPPLLKRASKPISPARFSRRLRGDDASVRRSSRSTKGVIQLLSIGVDAGLSYDDPTLKSKNRKRKRKMAASTTVGNELEESEPELPSSTVQVTLQNGTVLEADAVVCTVPLGMLKIPSDQPGHISFAPPLPESKQEAIRNLGCGLLNKCAMSFPAVFWQDSDFLGLAGEEHSYLVLNATKYTEKPILIFMYGGSFASELESWTDSEIVDDCLSVLKKICGRDVPAPVDYCITRWGQEQYSKMAFTYIPPGVDGSTQLSAMSEAIYDPVLPQKPLIMFAGEHTTPYHPSTIHGAFLSGIREAYRLDLFLEPQLNDYMVFEANEKLYQHTFTVRRIKSNTNKARKAKGDVSSKLPAVASAASTNPAQTSYRRRRGAGIMTLRKQPKTILESPVSAVAVAVVKKTPPPVIATSPSKSRRSQRSLWSKKPDEVDSPDPQDKSAVMEEKRRIQDALEDRVLMRAVDSYGRDVGILRSKILPVYGSTRRRKADQIRSRWHHTMQKRQEPPATWTSWYAPVVASLASAQTKTAPAEARGTTAEGKDEKVRRSRREVKPTARIDLDRLG